MAVIRDIYDFEELASDPDRLRTHLFNQLYQCAVDAATEGGRHPIYIEDEYYLDEAYHQWKDELAGIDDVYDMVAYAIRQSDDRNEELPIWEEFCG